jgi:dTMP kinase
MNRPGLFVTVDGPGGVGKSTTIRLVVDALRARGLAVHPTTEPSGTPIGDLIRHGTDTYHGLALAHLVVGDRHHHVTSEIRPRLLAGAVVVCDRYIPSSLVLQRLDGLDVDEIWRMNSGLDRPDLAVVLTADPAVIASRLAGRGGTHSRFERDPDSSHAEAALYRDTVARLRARGWTVHGIDCTATAAGEVARMVTDRILALHAHRSAHAHPDRAVPAHLQHR